MPPHNVVLQRYLARKRAEEERAASRLPQRTCCIHQSDRPDAPVDAVESGPFQNQLVAHQRLQRAKEKMLSNGWCSHQVNHLSRIHGFGPFSYLATLRRSSHRLADHTRCVGYTACVAYNADLSQDRYNTRHATEGCTCSMVSTPYSDLIKIIRNDGIPLISIESGTDADVACQLRVHPRSRVSKYIAISHVWADGFGNPNENGLPLCQTKRLKRILLALQKSFGNSNSHVLFWMDTLCIPVGPDERFLRLIQIDKMASIYKGAITSLVLDTELMATVLSTELASTNIREGDGGPITKSPTLSLESRARIACSVWMSRSWTLQEGELPPTIAVQFLDNAIILGRTSTENGLYQERFTTIRGGSRQRFRQNPDQGPSTPNPPIADFQEALEAGVSASLNVEEVDDRLPSFHGQDQNKHSPPPECECVDIALQSTFFSTFFKEEATEFVTLWNELAGRSTTRPEDVPMIVTNMMDFDNRGLLGYHDAGEMFQAIILSLGRLPLSLFFNAGPRQDQDGNHQNRWVPVKVGADTLNSNKLLSVCSSYLLYEHADQDISPEISVYMIDAILPLTSKVYLRSESEDTTYAVGPSNSSADQLDTGGFTSTCVIIENAVSPERPGVNRGACFYTQKDHKIERSLQSLRFWDNPIALPRVDSVDMTFNCPLQLQKVVGIAHPPPDQGYVYALVPIKHACNFRIGYDPIPKFKALKRREKTPLARLFGPDLATCFLVLGFIVPMFLPYLILAAARLPHNEAGFGLIVLGGYMAAIGLLGVAIALRDLVENLASWRYVRSFESIAKRRQEGAV